MEMEVTFHRSRVAGLIRYRQTVRSIFTARCDLWLLAIPKASNLVIALSPKALLSAHTECMCLRNSSPTLHGPESTSSDSIMNIFTGCIQAAPPNTSHLCLPFPLEIDYPDFQYRSQSCSVSCVYQISLRDAQYTCSADSFTRLGLGFHRLNSGVGVRGKS